MFKEGDAVVHTNRGAGVIRRVEERQWRGADALYYRIGLLSQPGSSLMIPVGAAKGLGLRRAASQSRLSKVWKVLGTDPQKLPKEHKERYQLLEDKLHAGDVLQVAEAVRDMAWRRHREGRLTTRGKQMYEEGMTLLAGEIAASKGIDIADAETQVRDRLQARLEVEIVA
jgi:RNA polymerase-interacting CarD/CdnL/TRCF family regulator